MFSNKSKFISLASISNKAELPVLFTFPFYYEVDSLCRKAAEIVQHYLVNQKHWYHNFGLDPEDKSLVIGKMFGVLIVCKEDGEVGFLASYSGKLGESNKHDFFVPPVYDMLSEEGFFKLEEENLNKINREIEVLECDEYCIELQKLYILEKTNTDLALKQRRDELKLFKKERQIKRSTAEDSLSIDDFEKLKEQLKEESLKQQFFFKLFVLEKEKHLNGIKAKLDVFLNRILELKQERKQRSNALQHKLFEQYQFCNAQGQNKSLNTIFTQELNVLPPAGAGECAAPKLLQYAYLNNYDPIAMAEFWWGQSPKSEIRKHKEFYPACRSKCEPILGHMLKGLNVQPNPMLENPAEGKELSIFFEDEYLLLVNKPAEFLSVPGKNILDSVQYRIQQKYPDSLLVHRLDQSTSGLLLVAKNKEIHKELQAQFLKRTVQKRYLAVLVGEVLLNEALIELPLRVDLDNRPHQLVCYTYGKSAKTKCEVISINNGETKVYFYPITGRTHQLRVHAAHPDGLNAAIKGDDLYGNKSDRLYLQAQYLELTHPIYKTRLKFELEPDF